jgi:hypothetical protein
VSEVEDNEKHPRSMQWQPQLRQFPTNYCNTFCRSMELPHLFTQMEARLLAWKEPANQ